MRLPSVGVDGRLRNASEAYVITIVAPTRPLIDRLHQTLRKADRDELVATVGEDNSEHIWACCESSTQVAVVVDAMGEPICVFGVAPYEGQPEVGIPWMLASFLILKYPKQLHVRAKAVLRDWHRAFPILTNATDKRNTLVLRWLQRLGFRLVREFPEYGVAKIPFIQFTRRVHV
jgi:ribosomal protein S18 acetylase RimI-like enzyme